MSGYDYGNARLRAMRSRLLTLQELTLLAGSGNLAELIAALSKTAYHRSLEVALIHGSLLDSIYDALRRDLMEAAQNIRRFYEDEQRRLIDIVLDEYDTQNIKTVLRGLSHHAPRPDIQNALLPVGSMSETVLNEMLRAASAREAIDILATIGNRYAQPLMRLRAEQPGADLFEMEVALERWRFQESVRALKAEEGGQPLLAALRLAADLENIMLLLRLVSVPAEQQQFKARMGKRNLEQLTVGIGTISVERLTSMLQARTVRSAINLLADTPYESALMAGLQAYERSNLLSEIEQALRRYQMRWLAGQIAKDPLGIGVILGYLALKTNEVANLRRIARGIQLKLGLEPILSLLEVTE